MIHDTCGDGRLSLPSLVHAFTFALALALASALRSSSIQVPSHNHGKRKSRRRDTAYKVQGTLVAVHLSTLDNRWYDKLISTPYDRLVSGQWSRVKAHRVRASIIGTYSSNTFT